jgi:hypothetical protein
MVVTSLRRATGMIWILNKLEYIAIYVVNGPQRIKLRSKTCRLVGSTRLLRHGQYDSLLHSSGLLLPVMVVSV